MEGETNCWQCNALLREPQRLAEPAKPSQPSEPQKPSGIAAAVRLFSAGRQPKNPPAPVDPAALIQFDPEHIPTEAPESIDAAAIQPAEQPQPVSEAQLEPAVKQRVTLTGEVIEELISSAPAETASTPAASIGNEQITAPITDEVMTLTFCKQCGYQNPEGVKECGQCGKQLEVIAVNDFKEIESLPRAYSFDVLGAIWIILGLAAILAGQFLVKTDASRPQASMADYLWTGVVAIAPGVLVIMRHHFCRLLFWVMTLGSIMVWSVIAVVWITGHLHVSDNGQVGLTWLFALSILSAISFFLVRTNDAFDYDIGVWLGRD
jgi:hypothetical protein